MLTPRPHQLEAIATGLRKNILLADECGLGKTLTAIELAKAIRNKLQAPILIVVTKSIKLQWIKALQEQGIGEGEIVTLSAKGFEGDASIKAPYILAHYEAVVKQVDNLRQTYFGLIVLDEAHKIRNRKTLRTQAVKKLRAFRKIAMTGTPWDRNPADAWSICNFLDPQFFRSYWKFYNAHINFKEVRVGFNKYVKQISPTQPLANPEGFARVMRIVTIRRYKKEVRSDLPERIDQVVPIAMAPDQARIYKKISEAEDVITQIAEGVEVSTPIVLTEILRLIQATTDPELLGVTGISSAKLDWLKAWLDENHEQPFIIFTRFRDTAEKIAALLKEGTSTGDWEPFDNVKLITGGTKREIVTAQDRVIVGTIAAMGEGLDLPHIDYAIFLDVEWSSILMQQAIDRIHRINIENVKHCIFLQAEGTVDELVYSAVINKWSTQELAHKYIEGRKLQSVP
jgi:SNF2 family DNA or RNA helicase